MIVYEITPDHEREIISTGKRCCLRDAERGDGTETKNPYRGDSNKAELWNKGYCDGLTSLGAIQS